MVRSLSSFFGSSDDAVWKLASEAHGEGNDWVCETLVGMDTIASGVEGVRGVGEATAGGLNHEWARI